MIYLFQSGAPSQLDLFDHKPRLERAAGHRAARLDPHGAAAHGHDLGAGRASRSPPAGFAFAQHGQSGAWVSELLPHTARVADELCFIKSMHTEAINHDPAITFFQTGAQLAGRPSMGAWVAYGLGSENQDLPAFVVMISQGSGKPNDQPLYDRLWGSGFLPTQLPGGQVPLASATRCSISRIPPGVDRAARRRMLDDLARLNELKHRRDRRSRDRSRASPSTRWPFACRPRCPS